MSPNQSAFVIPLVGDSSDQGVFSSEEMLKKTLVATKEIQVPHRWVQTGRMSTDGEYRKSATVILVDRSPISREWTPDDKTGTDAKNQGVRAETKESIGFTASMSITAQTDENDSVKFLYHYNNGSLAQILDGEIRDRVAGDFNEQCSKYTLTDLLVHKEDIMKAIRDDVQTYYKDRGINITNLSLHDQFTYDNKNIQDAIDKTFSAQKDYEAQKATNQKNIEKAEADAKALEIQKSNLDAQIKLKQIEVEDKKAEAMLEMGKNWRPSVIGGNSLFNMPLPTGSSDKK